MTEQVTDKPASLWMQAKYRLAVAGVSAMGLVGMAAAEINLSSITELISAVTGIIPDLMDLIIAVIPIVVLMALVSFILGLLAAILGLIKIKF